MRKKSDETFSELIHKFIIGGGKTCFQACYKNSVVVGSARRTKCEKKISDSRTSIALAITGGVDSDTFHTAFVIQGGRCREGYNEAFFNKFGAMEGSTILITDSVFMAMEMWLEIMPSMIRGMRRLSIYVDKNPQW